MARIPEVTEKIIDPIVKEVFDSQLKTHGFIFNTAKIYAHRPTIMRGHNLISQGVDESGLLNEELKALVCIQVASINGCPF